MRFAGTLGSSIAWGLELAERANIPVTTSLQGLGVFREDHDLSLQMLGMHGSAVANYAMQSVRISVPAVLSSVCIKTLPMGLGLTFRLGCLTHRRTSFWESESGSMTV